MPIHLQFFVEVACAIFVILPMGLECPLTVNKCYKQESLYYLQYVDMNSDSIWTWPPGGSVCLYFLHMFGGRWKE